MQTNICNGSVNAVTLSLSPVKTLLIIMTALFCFSTVGFATPTDYYVDPINGHDGSQYPGTETDPFKTLTYTMNERAEPGDTIILREGDYYEEHEDHPSRPLTYPPPQGWECNLGYPEDFPIYLKENVTIRAYDNAGVYENVVLKTVHNCNEDILRVYIQGYGGAQWRFSSEADDSQIIGIKFKTKSSGPWYEGSG